MDLAYFVASYWIALRRALLKRLYLNHNKEEDLAGDTDELLRDSMTNAAYQHRASM